MYELGYPIDVDDLDVQGREVGFALDKAQRDALAASLGLLSLDRLEVTAQIRRREDESVIANGSFRAAVVQRCVVTLDPVESVLEEPFEVRYVPPVAQPSALKEVEIGTEDEDIEPFDGSAIDLGRTVAEYLALAIDPYPRRKGAEFRLQSGDSGDSSPFAALAKLRNNL